MSYLRKRTGIKTVISGLAAVGTTTIYRTLIDGQLPPTWATYHATINHNYEKKVVDDLILVFYDLAGQTAYLDSFTGEMAEFIFSGVNVLVFVIDSSNFFNISRAKYYLDLEIKLLQQFSPRALLIILQHKADFIPTKLKEEAHQVFYDFFLKGISRPAHYFSTSVINASFYHSIEEVLRLTVHNVDPNINFTKFKMKFWGEIKRVIPPSTPSNSHYDSDDSYWKERFKVLRSYLEDE